MLENDANTSPSPSDEYHNSSAEYLSRAAQACKTGDTVLGMHLYLAAFERAHRSDGSAPDEAALGGLKQAWKLACKLRERSIAEYVFERLEPYLSSDETLACAAQLQDLALDKLQEFGLTREDLEGMTDAISQDFMGSEGSRLLQVEHLSTSAKGDKMREKKSLGLSIEVLKPKQVQESTKKKVSDSSSEAAHRPTPEASGADDFDSKDVSEGRRAVSIELEPPSASVVTTLESITFKDLIGYDKTIATMHDFGVGMKDDEQFHELVEQLNKRHGLEGIPAADVLLFRSPAREDANRFMAATLGELGLPALRMRMEENLQGIPVLCVMTQADNQPHLNMSKSAFEGPGVLILEDLDMWVSPVNEPMGNDFGGLLLASLSRGAREAISLIRSAVENPEVYVLASASDNDDIEPFFYELLEPLTVVEIDYPTTSERAAIWIEIASKHPSFQGINQEELVRYSAQMARYDLYMAAREAVEEVYKASLVARRYMPVTPHNIFEKLAAYQPLDSEEYHELEEAVVSSFRHELEGLEDMLEDKGKGEDD